jgi:hypothetical protein
MPHFTHLFKGDILYPKVHALCSDCWGHDEEDNPQRWVTFCPQFPHLFRPLKWWEGLAIDDLPMYVKWVDGNDTEYFKVLDWHLIVNESIHDDDGLLFTHIEPDGFEQGFVYNYDGEIYPATEAEYNDYLTKLNGK